MFANSDNSIAEAAEIAGRFVKRSRFLINFKGYKIKWLHKLYAGDPERRPNFSDSDK